MEIDLLSITPGAERHIERAGRTAYLSSRRVTAESAGPFIRMLIERGHTSVLEHASASFRIRGVSRAFTHQLVRHRLCSFTQQSQRYVDESSFRFVEPESITNNFEARPVFTDAVYEARKAYVALQRLGIPKEDARFVLPNATQSEIVITANFREWRHIIQLRGSQGAQWEIRRVAIGVLRILKEKAPNVFGDLEIDLQKQVVRKT